MRRTRFPRQIRRQEVGGTLPARPCLPACRPGMRVRRMRRCGSAFRISPPRCGHRRRAGNLHSPFRFSAVTAILRGDGHVQALCRELRVHPVSMRSSPSAAGYRVPPANRAARRRTPCQRTCLTHWARSSRPPSRVVPGWRCHVTLHPANRRRFQRRCHSGNGLRRSSTGRARPSTGVADTVSLPV